MNPFLKSTDTCCLCQKPATKTIPLEAAFMGRKLQVMAAICPVCDQRKDRDSVLDAYCQRIFSGGMMR